MSIFVVVNRLQHLKKSVLTLFSLPQICLSLWLIQTKPEPFGLPAVMWNAHSHTLVYTPLLQHHATAFPVWQLVCFGLFPCWLVSFSHGLAWLRHPQPVTEVYAKTPYVSPHYKTEKTGAISNCISIISMYWGENKPPYLPVGLLCLSFHSAFKFTLSSEVDPIWLIASPTVTWFTGSCSVSGIVSAPGKITRLYQMRQWGCQHSLSEAVFIHSRLSR